VARGIINPVTGITEGAMRTLLKSNLRPIWRRTSRKTFLLSVRYKATNPKTGRLWNVVDCKDCGRVMGVSEKERRIKKDGTPSKKARSILEVDHVEGITPLGDIRGSLGDHWYDMIYGKQEVVCHLCHKIRTSKQATQRSSNK
jgi:hypothetical protein